MVNSMKQEMQRYRHATIGHYSIAHTKISSSSVENGIGGDSHTRRDGTSIDAVHIQPASTRAIPRKTTTKRASNPVAHYLLSISRTRHTAAKSWAQDTTASCSAAPESSQTAAPIRRPCSVAACELALGKTFSRIRHSKSVTASVGSGRGICGF